MYDNIWLIKIRTNIQKRSTNNLTRIDSYNLFRSERGGGEYFHNICKMIMTTGATTIRQTIDMSIASVRCSTVVNGGEYASSSPPLSRHCYRERANRRATRWTCLYVHTYTHVCIACIGIADKWRPARRSEIWRTRARGGTRSPWLLHR